MSLKKVFSLLAAVAVLTAVMVLMAGCGKIPSAFVGDYSGTVEDNGSTKWTATVERDGSITFNFANYGKMEGDVSKTGKIDAAGSKDGKNYEVTGKIRSNGKLDGTITTKSQGGDYGPGQGGDYGPGQGGSQSDTKAFKGKKEK